MREDVPKILDVFVLLTEKEAGPPKGLQSQATEKLTSALGAVTSGFKVCFCNSTMHETCHTDRS